jgi:lipopolysaccharide/colanic/teichoic acid biosynthesis glycosyltransferase
LFWRQLLFFCACLDLLGGLALFWLLDRASEADVLVSVPLAGFFLASYVLLGWLFGSYTVLRWPWLQLRLVLVRLGFTAIGSLATGIALDWILNLPDTVELTHRSTLLIAVGLLTCWALMVRLGLRLLVRRLRPERRWHLMAHPTEVTRIMREWQRTPFVKPLSLISRSSLQTPEFTSGRHTIHGIPSGGLVVGAELRLALDKEGCDRNIGSSGVPITTVIELAESQLERLPPALLPEDWLLIEAIPWANSFSVQRQLKRVADVGVSLFLLVLTLPLMLLVALLIWLEDRGPVFYHQKRSGLMGRTFILLKLRTMRCADPGDPPSWTRPGDSRITRVGQLLRRTRFDELPQLLNVLSGEMSLIGPRPERPELEQELEIRIPHYRKRHWMKPGLSGWAQVSAPYAASLDEAELKLSYDLYYLRNWSILLDLLILFKTIKTVLKSEGR